MVFAAPKRVLVVALMTCREWSMYSEHDLVVDQNNNLHIVAAVNPLDLINGIIDVTPGDFMICDVYTTDQGTTWRARLINSPMTYDGSSINPSPYPIERNRAAVSRTWNGDKLFYTYFDTDTILYPDSANTLPNAYCVGYDVNTGMTTPVVNLTAGSVADTACRIGNLSYYVFGNSGSYSIPITYSEILASGIANHHYVCGTMTDAMFTIPDTSVGLSTLLYNRFGTVGIEEQKNNFSISTPYPNPTHDVINIPVSVSNKTNLKIEITNTLGQVVKTLTVANAAGQQVIKIKIADYAKGIYFVSVTANEKTSSAKFAVE